MPDLSTLLLFMVAAGVVVAIPGPNHLYITTRSVSQGRSAGLTSAAGVETGTLVHIAATALGLSSIIASSALAFSVIKYAGATYLIYLGLRTLLRRPKPSRITAERSTRYATTKPNHRPLALTCRAAKAPPWPMEAHLLRLGSRPSSMAGSGFATFQDQVSIPRIGETE